MPGGGQGHFLLCKHGRLHLQIEGGQQHRHTVLRCPPVILVIENYMEQVLYTDLVGQCPGSIPHFEGQAKGYL